MKRYYERIDTREVLIWIVTMCAVLLSLPGSSHAQDGPSFIGYVPDQIIVQFAPASKTRLHGPDLARGKTGMPALDNLGARHGAVSVTQRFPGLAARVSAGKVIDPSAFYRITFKTFVDVETVAAEYAALPEVLTAEPIGIHRTYATPNDPQFPNQWHLDQANDADIDAPETWEMQTGQSSVVVAVLDTGVRYFHEDLGGTDASINNPEAADGNMWINTAEKNGTPGVDDDGNGYVDDWIGWDFVETTTNCWSGEDCGTADNDPRDFNGHGTHCAGIVAAINNNGVGVSSTTGGWGDGTSQPTANGVKVMALRIGWSYNYFGYEFGVVQMDYAAEALYYAAAAGVRIASCSWGSSDTGGLGAAIDYFVAGGGLIFKAAGNDNLDDPDYMSSRLDVVAVAATDQNDCKASFSNYGTWVDISAPGVSIVSTYHDHDSPSTDAYASASGTSMATPMVAGVAAAVWSADPSLGSGVLLDVLCDNADDIDALACNVSYAGKLGAGRINAFRAVAAVSAIVFLHPLGGEEWIVGDTETIQWTPCSSCNFTDQEIQISHDDGDTWSSLFSGVPPTKGFQRWTIAGPVSSETRLKVVGNGPTQVVAVSLPFTVDCFEMALVNPVGGEVFEKNDNVLIETDVGAACETVSRVYELTRDGGTTWETLGSNSDDQFQWHVSGATSNNCKIRVTGTTSYESEVVMSGVFEIVPENPGNGGCAKCDPPALPVSTAPGVTRLIGNTPNPFNPTTTIHFELAEQAETTLRIYDVRGALVREVQLGVLGSGHGSWTWNGANDLGAAVGGGVYFVRFRAGAYTETAKMILLK